MRRIRATLKGIAKIIHEIIHKTISGFGNVTLEYPVADGLEAVTLYGGTEQDDTDIVSSVTLEGATEQRNVPEGYTELEYIRNVISSTKFNTELTPQNGDVLELVRTAGAPTVSNYMFQSREGTTAGIYGISGSSSGGTIMGNRGSGQSLQSEILRTNGHKYYTKMSVIGTTLTLTVKDLTDKLENTKTREITDTTPGSSKYYLWGNATQAQAIGTAQNVYFACISNNGVDRIRLIPAKQGNTVGFYDMVSKTFMTTFVGSDPTASTTTATAYPYVPMNIVGNNGAIKVHKNLVDKSKVVRGDIDSTYGTVNAIQYRAVSDFIPILNGQTYTFRGKIRIEGKQTVYNASKPIIALYDSSKNYISGTRTLQNSYTFTINNANASYIRVEWRGGSAQGDVVDLENSEFQFQVGPYQTTYEEGSGIYIEGQTETVQDALGNTATAEMLLKVSISNDYIDTQEVLTGAITRRIAIKVLDGTENWSVNSGDYNFFRLNNAVDFSGNLTTGFYCTHFVPASIASASNNQGIRLNSNSIFLRFDGLYPATTGNLPLFKQWLSEQYANGTPVIVVYPLSTATTESVEGQELIEAPITQTAGSISNMTITVTSDGGVPSPTSPKDIICNNGAIKYILGKNIFDKDNATVLNIAITNNVYSTNNERYGVAVRIKPNTTYTFSFTQGNPSIYINIGLSADYPTVGGRCTYYGAGVISSYTFTTGNTDNYVYVYSTRTSFLDSMQIEEGSRATEYEEYTNPIVTEGNVETVEDEAGNTATAQMLLKIGDRVDTQEVLTGAIERKIGIRVFDGTENWTRNDTRVALDLGDNYNGNDSILYCTHYKGYTAGTSISNLPDMGCKFANTSTGSLLIKDSVHNTTLADWKAYLASEYANGTPVIVVYPLATATTESVTGQTLTSVAGDTNTIEITQAGMNPTDLQLEVDYLGYDM